MRIHAHAGLAIAAAAAAAGCADTTKIDGSYQATYDAFEHETVEAGRDVVNMPFKRVDAFPDVSDLETCKDPEERNAGIDTGTFVQGLADPSTTMVALTFGATEVRWEVILFHGTDDACRLDVNDVHPKRAATYTLDGDEIVVTGVASSLFDTDDSDTTTLDFELDGDQLLLSHPVDYEPSTAEDDPDEDLLENQDDYDWAYGTWVSTHNAHDRLVVDAETHTLSFVALRQVGGDGEGQPAFPTVCKWTVQGNRLTVDPGDDTRTQTLRYTGERYALEDFDGNSSGCADYVASLEEAADQGDAAGSLTLQRLDDGNLLVEGRTYEPAG